MRTEKAKARIRSWRENPVQFVYDNFQVDPDPWQREALSAFASTDEDKRRISLQACAGPGKSAVLAWCGWNFLGCYAEKGNHPKGAAVSITADNLKDNLWPEFSKWQSRSEYLKAAFTWTKERIYANDHPETWFMSARSFAKTANEEEQGRTMSGLHSEFVLCLFDESGDMPPAVLRAGEQALTACKWGKLMQAGNPTSHTGMLYAAATRLRHQWYIIRITSDPDDPNRSSRIDIKWAREQIQNYGRDNPWVMAYILGMFPPSSLNTILGIEEVEDAMGRHLTPDKFEWAQKRLGIDVARFGDDRSVIFPRQGLAAFRPVEMRGARTTDIAARVALAKDRWGSQLELIDDTGHWGHGVIDNLIAAGHSPVGIQFHAPAIDKRYKNRRAEMWLQMAEWVKRGGALPNIPELVAELTTPQYTFVNGQFQLEDKDRIKERLGRSPDLADALALTFALPDMPHLVGVSGLPLNKSDRAKTDYDPFGG